jgi:pimeloyl-ACP methyl ester carboxylesterase
MCLAGRERSSSGIHGLAPRAEAGSRAPRAAGGNAGRGARRRDRRDGGKAAFEAEIDARTPQAGRRRAQELGERAMAGEGTDAEFLEAMEIFWPASFPDPDNVPPMPPMRTSAEAFGGIDPEMTHGLEHIAAELSTGQVPYAALAGAGSPIPWGQASRATVELSPRASLTSIGAAGHFPWIDEPGCVLAALRRLV